MNSLFETTVVIPAFNEQDRLPRTLEALCTEHDGLSGVNLAEVIVVDDGSKDDTSRVAALFSGRLPQLSVVTLEQNCGKGFAVRSGLMNAQSEWILVADADMSTPWAELAKLASELKKHGGDVAIGSRDLPESDVVLRQSFIREYLGRTFNVLIRTLTGLPFRDTQCGFKLVRRSSVKSFLGDLTVDRFAWDVEFLLLARDADLEILEVPVSWEHRDASRVHPIFDGFDMAKTVLCLQLRRLRKRLFS